MLRLGGLKTETDYPYVGHRTQCKLKNKPITKKDIHIDSFVELPHNETSMRTWIYQNGPISVGNN